MDDSEKTKDELISELTALRRRVAEIAEREAGRGKREEAFTDLFNATEELTFLQELDGTVVVANDCTGSFYGISREDIVGRSIYEFIFQDKIESAKKRIGTVIETGRTLRFEGTLGGRVFENSLYPVFDPEGRARRVAVYVRDITVKKSLEEAVQNERNRFQTLSDNAPFGIMVINRKGDFTYLNPKFTELFGYDLQDVPTGMEFYKKAFPDIKEREAVVSSWMKEVKNTEPGQRVARMLTITCKDGRKKSVNFIPVRLATGEYLVSIDDITERIHAQEALIQSHKQLEDLNRAKTKAVDHISHELRTPLAVIQGNVRILKRKIQAASMMNGKIEVIFDGLERNLERLQRIQRETDEIFRVTQAVEANVLLDDLERLWERIENFSGLPPDVHKHLEALKQWVGQYRASGVSASVQPIDLYLFVRQVVEKAQQSAPERKIVFHIERGSALSIAMDPLILSDLVEGLVKNAIENTPDGSRIEISFEQKGDRIWLHVTDYGVGIREENQQYLFDGLFHTKETDLYSSRRPYDFGAGGKGLELLRMKVYGQHFGFDISMKSKRCTYLPTDQDLCPGDVSQCPHITGPEGCLASGGTTFSVAFPKR